MLIKTRNKWMNTHLWILKWMKEYTFMFMNVHKKHTIYGKGDEDQRGTIRTLPKMVKNYEQGWMFLKMSFQSILSKFCILWIVDREQTCFCKIHQKSFFKSKMKGKHHEGPIICLLRSPKEQTQKLSQIKRN